jgi:hypothetical protein
MAAAVQDALTMEAVNNCMGAVSGPYPPKRSFSGPRHQEVLTKGQGYHGDRLGRGWRWCGRSFATCWRARMWNSRC